MQHKNFYLATLMMTLGAAPVLAAEDPTSRMDRIERRMMALEHQTFGSNKSGGAESTDAADVEARLGAMEEENGKLYGTVEELGKAVQELARKMDFVVKDMDLRLQDMEKKSKAQ